MWRTKKLKDETADAVCSKCEVEEYCELLKLSCSEVSNHLTGLKNDMNMREFLIYISLKTLKKKRF